jgi:hypothetical protein
MSFVAGRGEPVDGGLARTGSLMRVTLGHRAVGCDDDGVRAVAGDGGVCVVKVKHQGLGAKGNTQRSRAATLRNYTAPSAFWDEIA